MKLTFLSGRVPLTKTIVFNTRSKTYSVNPYPLVNKVTSTEVEVAHLHDMAVAIREQAARAACLLKGNLVVDLKHESRAGKTLETPHEWVCIDFDKVDYAPTHLGVEAAVNNLLPPYMRNVSFVSQLSASCHHPHATKLSAHVFFMLDKPIESNELREWLTWLNFQEPVINSVTLTPSNTRLHFPIDRALSSNSQLIYIAPPRCVGFTSAIKDPVAYIKRKHPVLSIPSFSPIPLSTVDAKVAELRKAANLEEIAFKTRHFKTSTGPIEVLTNAEPVRLHDFRDSGNGFINFNMNGGNSMGYYVSKSSPEFIRNFKDEPCLLTKEVAPDFYKTLIKATRSLPPIQTDETTEILAFYATNRQSTVYIGHYNRETNVLRVDPSNVNAAGAWLAGFGIPPSILPHIDIAFDVHDPIRYEPGHHQINLYTDSEYMKIVHSSAEDTSMPDSTLQDFYRRCPVIYNTIFSAVGSNKEVMWQFINWLATLCRLKTKLGTAWVLHGIEGTGKGALYHHVLRPLLSETVTTMVNFTLAGTNFNSFLDNKLLVVFDEASLSKSHDSEELMQKLKNWITEPTVVINEKGKVEREIKSSSNFLFFSNESRPVVISDSDRRFHVGAFQTQRLIYTPNQWAILESREELKAFSELIGTWPCDEEAARTVKDSEEKTRISEATHSLVEQVAIAIRKGDTQFFIDARPTEYDNNLPMKGNVGLLKTPYDALLRAMRDGTLNVLTVNDLYTLFRVAIPDDRRFPESAAEQRRMYKRFGLLSDTRTSVRCKRTNKIVHGSKAPDWVYNQVIAEQIEAILGPDVGDNVVDLARRKK